MGNYDARCPTCGKIFDKFPNRWGNCPFCKNRFYPTRRPGETGKMLVNKAEKAIIDEEWRKDYVRKRIENELSHDKYYNYVVWKLKQNQIELTFETIQFGILGENSKVYIQEGKWGLLASAKRRMSDILYWLGKKDQAKLALRLAIEAAYLAINGAGNTNSPKELYLDPPFDRDLGIIINVDMDNIMNWGDELGLTGEDLRKRFMEITMPVYVKWGPPVSPGEAWEMIKDRVFLSKDYPEKYNDYE